MKKTPWEVFLPITYPNVGSDYAISNTGKVFDLSNKCNVPEQLDEYGLLYVMLFSSDYEPTRFRIHRLVAWEFCPGRNVRHSVAHIDGNSFNNHYQNLKWFVPDSLKPKSGVDDSLSNIAQHIRNTQKKYNFYHTHPDKFIEYIQRKHPTYTITKSVIDRALKHKI